MSEEDRKKDFESIVAFRKLSALGVTTLRQAMVLLVISYQDTITTGEMAKAIGSARPNAGQLASQLKEKGLIKWTSSIEKRRYKRVYFLTQKGKLAVELARKA